MNNEMIKELLDLHCVNCNGKMFGCKGCLKQDNIIAIIDKYTEKPEIIEVEEVIEESTEEKPKKKKTKKA